MSGFVGGGRLAERRDLGASDPRLAVEQSPGRPVELHVGPITVNRRERAEFRTSSPALRRDGQGGGDVDGEHLESQEFRHGAAASG
jgi:hypothetical protein